MRRRARVGLAALWTLVLALGACDAQEARSRGTTAHGGASGQAAVSSVEAAAPAWGPEELISEYPSNDAVAVLSRDGTALVASSGPRRIRSRQASSGEPWQQAQRVPGAYDNGQIVGAGVDDVGTVTLIWADELLSMSRYRIFASRHRAGGAWSRPRLLASGPAEDIGLWMGPFAEVGAGGAVVVAWQEGDGSRLRAVYRPTGGRWTRPVTLPGARGSAPAVSVGSRGLATVAYEARRGRLIAVQRSRHRWHEPARLPARGAPFDIDAARPREVVVVWKNRRDVLRVARLHPRGWRSQRLTAADRVHEVYVEALPNGSATVAWPVGRFGTPSEFRVLDQAASGSVGQPVVLAPRPLGRSCDLPVVERNRAGDALVAWIGKDDDSSFGGDVFVAYRSRSMDEWSPAHRLTNDGSAADCSGVSGDLAPDGSALLAWTEVHTEGPKEGQPRRLIARRLTPSDR